MTGLRGTCTCRICIAGDIIDDSTSSTYMYMYDDEIHRQIVSLALDFYFQISRLSVARLSVSAPLLLSFFFCLLGCIAYLRPPEAAKGSHDVRAKPRLLWTGESMLVVFGVVVMVR